jgi:hypothetical protein
VNSAICRYIILCIPPGRSSATSLERDPRCSYPTLRTRVIAIGGSSLARTREGVAGVGVLVRSASRCRDRHLRWCRFPVREKDDMHPASTVLPGVRIWGVVAAIANDRDGYCDGPREGSRSSWSLALGIAMVFTVQKRPTSRWSAGFGVDGGAAGAANRNRPATPWRPLDQWRYDDRGTAGSAGDRREKPATDRRQWRMLRPVGCCIARDVADRLCLPPAAGSCSGQGDETFS